MTELDQALEAARQNNEARSAFYELFLHTNLYIPTHDAPAEGQDAELKEGESVVPLIAEAEGKDYLLLFDTQERLAAWAEREMPFICLPGYAVTEMSPAQLNWALNVGTEYAREFAAEEVAWLKDVVEKFEAQAADEEGEEGAGDDEE